MPAAPSARPCACPAARRHLTAGLSTSQDPTPHEYINIAAYQLHGPRRPAINALKFINERNVQEKKIVCVISPLNALQVFFFSFLRQASQQVKPPTRPNLSSNRDARIAVKRKRECILFANFGHASHVNPALCLRRYWLANEVQSIRDFFSLDIPRSHLGLAPHS